MAGLLLFATSCKDDDSEDLMTTPETCIFGETYDIRQIRSAEKQEVEMAYAFLQDNQAHGKTHFNPDDDYIEKVVVEYTNLEGKAVVLTYDDEDKDGDELSLILVADEENELITFFEHDRKVLGDTYQVSIYLEGAMWLYALLDKDTEDILDFSFYGGKSTDNEEESMTFNECVAMAVTACLDDPECAFICGIIWKYCLGSIAIACFFTTMF